MIYTPPKTNGSSLFRILPTLTARSPKMRVLVQMMFLFNGVILRFKMWNFRGVDDGLGVVVSILFAYIVSICWALSKNDNSALGTGTGISHPQAHELVKIRSLFKSTTNKKNKWKRTCTSHPPKFYATTSLTDPWHTHFFGGGGISPTPTPHLHCSMENTRAQFVEEVVRLGRDPPNAGNKAQCHPALLRDPPMDLIVP